MTDTDVEFHELIALGLAQAVGVAGAGAPRPEVKRRLLAAVRDAEAPPVPLGFAFRLDIDDAWLPHPVPGIRMKVLSINRKAGYATLLLDVAPGTRFPAHHHGGDEECYVVSGTLFSCGRRIAAGDFLHADAETDHGELWTEDGCRVLLVVKPEDYMPDPLR